MAKPVEAWPFEILGVLFFGGGCCRRSDVVLAFLWTASFPFNSKRNNSYFFVVVVGW